ncbi:AAA family ATPase [Natronoglomus mannanivorans]|uniref:AAA family ATPase n=1 Tax=Natronoglomus mannanivorans TaxID=2979990 RepID=A0AAP2Z2B9_9EURY|nr:AAA family ATPase [Halobacteria archaeon AArc-xg1-1]
MSIQLESLTVRAFRGVRGEERFEFNGRNAVVAGPNGSGKSTVLQAIEFLLTGHISALRGSGTGGIKTTEHIPNQYANPDNTAVEGTFALEGEDSFRVVREFTNRSRMKAERRPEAFTELVTAANQGLLHLSRDELLELVITTPGDRKDQIYQLMNTEGLDERRRQLKRLAKKANREASTNETRYEDNLQQIQEIAGDEVVTSIDGEPELRPVALCDAVNVRRERVGGDPIASIDAVESFEEGLTSPLDQASNPLQRDDVRRQLTQLEDWVDDERTAIVDVLDDLRQELRALRADEDALTALAERSLVERGRTLVDATTRECPLCEKPWGEGELNAYLENRADRLERIESRVETIDGLAGTVRRELDSVTGTLDRLLEALSTDEVEIDLRPLAQYGERLETVVQAVDGDLTDDPKAVDLETLCLPETHQTDVRETLTELRETAGALPERSTIESTWGQLQTLDGAHNRLRTAATERKRFARAANEFEIAHETFLATRDDVLGDIFETISDRFASFYRAVNPDESAFNPTIGQTNTGVDFSVEFFDTGEHPPNALHSEGHQDLMGVCLFLALASELSPLERTPVLLDDVVMSVDEGHREQFAKVLRDEFSDHFQFLIATHDETWVGQLVEMGVVREQEVARFTEWTPDRGSVLEADQIR